MCLAELFSCTDHLNEEPRTLFQLEELILEKRVEVLDLEQGFFKIVHPPESLKSLPETELELFRLQNVLLSNHRGTEAYDSAWADMFVLLVNYVKSLIQKRITNKTYIEPDEITGMAVTTVAKHCESHYGTNQFKAIRASFGGLLSNAIFGELYCKKKQGYERMEVSFDQDFRTSDNGSVPMSEVFTKDHSLKAYEHQQMVQSNTADFEEAINLYLSEVDSANISNKLKILVRPYLLLKLRQPKTQNYDLSFFRNMKLDHIERAIIERCYEEFVSRLYTEIGKTA